MRKPKDLYIITTAAKRDTLDWERECAEFALSTDRDSSISGVKVTIDSWNNIKKYKGIKNCFFIFDEQRLVGSGTWVKSFLKITKLNNWILLSATPGDTWMDYIAVFVANGFYKTRTEFIRTHVVYNTFTKYPKVDHYVEEGKLLRLKREILVDMFYVKPTSKHYINIAVSFDKKLFDMVAKNRWNPYSQKPIKDVGEFCHVMRKVANSDLSRLEATKELAIRHQKIIVFYNFNYELDILRKLSFDGFVVAEYNGQKHEKIPKTQNWIYLVQYTAGAEGWNCIETNAMIFYSQNYSYRMTVQAAGRIDRLNTPFSDLYYYTLKSQAVIDVVIFESLKKKRDFNEHLFDFPK